MGKKALAGLSWHLVESLTEAEFDLVFGEGINKTMELVEMGERCGVIAKAGSWLSFGGDQVGQGREQAEKRLRADASLRDALAVAIRDAMAQHPLAPAMPAHEDARPLAPA